MASLFKETRMKAIVDFRTLANGSYKYMRGLRRGYVRVIVVRDEKGSMSCASNNVQGVLVEFSPGIDGVTERSRYYLGGDYARAQEIADAWNAEHALSVRQQMTASDDGMAIHA